MCQRLLQPIPPVRGTAVRKLDVRRMARLGHFIHRRSISVAAVALILSLPALGEALGFSVRSPGADVKSVARSVVVCLACFGLCVAALVNLVRDVDRGYSPGRCSLAAVILLFAFGSPTLLAFALLRFATR